MEVKSVSNGFFLRFLEGEDFHAVLADFCADHRITSGTFSGIGMARSTKLSFWDTDHRKYEDTLFDEHLEIVSLSGNISFLNEAVAVHVHGSFGRRDHSTVSGHVTSLIVGATLELSLIDLQIDLSRRFNEETGLNLLSLDRE
jgi:predicted DNA-binding protein with PD1-like motif